MRKFLGLVVLDGRGRLPGGLNQLEGLDSPMRTTLLLDSPKHHMELSLSTTTWG